MTPIKGIYDNIFWSLQKILHKRGAVMASVLIYLTIQNVCFFLPHSDMYLRGGDQNGSIHSVLLKVFQYGQMLI